MTTIDSAVLSRALENLARELSALGDDLNEVALAQASINARLDNIERSVRRTEDQGLERKVAVLETEIRGLREAKTDNKDSRAHMIALAGLVVAILSMVFSVSISLPSPKPTGNESTPVRGPR